MSPVIYQNPSSSFVWANALAFFIYDLVTVSFRKTSDEFFDNHPEKAIISYSTVACSYSAYWGTITAYLYYNPPYESISIPLSIMLVFSIYGGFSIWLLSRRAGQTFIALLFLPSIIAFIYKGTLEFQIIALFFALTLIGTLRLGDARTSVFLDIIRGQIKAKQDASEYKAISNEDILTGINNRRYFDMHFESEVKKANEQQIPISLFVLDIDHFKQVNDTYGHDAGDQCIKQTAEVLKSETRDTDFLCRFGGEEFVVVLPGTNRASAKTIAERMIRAVRSKPLKYGDTEINFTVSIGACTYEGGDYNHKHLFKQTDEALYRAKSLGRDRIVFGEPQLAG
ncbi:MAG: GGDEF domain-containing protein [Cellvibrionaceae bacterium]